MSGRRGAELVLHGITALSYGMLCAVLTPLGPNPLATLLLPVSSGYAVARGWWTSAAVLIGVASLSAAMIAALMASADPVQWAYRSAPVVVVLWYAGAALAGLPLGLGIARSWSWRKTFGAAMVPLMAVTALFVAVFWESWLAGGQDVFTFFDAWVRRGSLGEDMTEAQVARALEQGEWLMVTHWADISLGFMFGMCALPLAAGLTGANIWYRWRTSEPGLGRGWLTTRMPDALAWVVIAVAVLWFVDDRWSIPAFRMVSWNAAIGLVFLYWIVGMAVLLYTLRAAGAHPALIFAAVMLVFLFQIHLMVAMVGLFDTWADFRSRLDNALAARKERAERGDDEW